MALKTLSTVHIASLKTLCPVFHRSHDPFASPGAFSQDIKISSGDAIQILRSDKNIGIISEPYCKQYLDL